MVGASARLSAEAKHESCLVKADKFYHGKRLIANSNRITQFLQDTSILPPFFLGADVGLQKDLGV
jgi:hypothetical protein